jgi:peptidoglycan hydrolase-like protein with peptidoglycan-binding domain
VKPTLLAIVALLAAAAVLAAPASAHGPGSGGLTEAPTVGSTPYDRQGMWIWYVSHSEGGSVPAIVRRAKAAGIGTVYVKSGDGPTFWNQFNRVLVGQLHRAGLDVCAWQFVYGDHPRAEARTAALAISRGADCFVIDAEADYEGKYAAADLYMQTVRDAAGANYPISLAGFPYVDYHPAFPYSVFLGPGGAQFNQPQMYWKAIGTSVRGVFEHTYLYNRIWGHPIYPIGQTYEAPGNGQLRLFRRFAASFGGMQPSWWDWQETDETEWAALGVAAADRPLPGFQAEVEHPLLKVRSKGDLVVWAQEKLDGAGAEVPVTGIFGRDTLAAVRAFQEAHDLPVTGVIATETWGALMDVEPTRVEWNARPALPGATDSRAHPAHRPLSATLPPRGREIPPRP